jgi:hypothetical protein
MTVPEAVSFVKKRYPQFSNFWNDFEPHLESSEACYKQRTFQEAEATPKMQSRMNILDKRTGPRENRKQNDRARNNAYVESQKKKDEARQMNEALVRIDKGNK